ncbi:hypothetical protein JI752_018650 [Lysobacter sp. MMG2]|uniref:hypothetical protein n=1 Tax=Lysobacter sp. MMG2 TaxID=2801338 RepID=UPI001C21834B|nr:hypothetical protein [Lysobacter sp. MMG2]MBU8978172.1 hypothetical protein [Lysobacter sp. MMG2]
MHWRHGGHVHGWLTADVASIHIAQQADLLLGDRSDLVAELTEGNVGRRAETLGVNRVLHLLLRERELRVQLILRAVAEHACSQPLAERNPVLAVAIDGGVRDLSRHVRAAGAEERSCQYFRAETEGAFADVLQRAIGRALLTREEPIDASPCGALDEVAGVLVEKSGTVWVCHVVTSFAVIFEEGPRSGRLSGDRSTQ